MPTATCSRFRIALVLTAAAILSVSQSHAGDVTPAKLTAAIADLEKLAGQTLAKTGVPGMAIVIVHGDRIVYTQGFGVREIGKPAAVDAETVFSLASISKSLTSTVLAIQVGRGTMNWDDRIIDHDSAFRLLSPETTREVTFRDLLCHRSGLADHEGDLLEDMGYDRTAILHRLRFARPGSSFRSQFAYTNFGVTEAGVAGAKAAGKSWEDLAVETLFKPLGMESTSPRFKDYIEARNRAVQHAYVEGKYVAKYIRDADAQSPAGGVSSNVKDMGQWIRLQLASGKFEGKQLVAKHALEETHRPQIVSHPPANPGLDRAGFYGLGWNVNYDDRGRVRLGHSGAFDQGAATVVNLMPAEDLGIAILTNAAPRGIPEALAATFLELAINGKCDQDFLTLFEGIFRQVNQPTYGLKVNYAQAPEQPSPASPLKAYVGTYHNDYYGPIAITQDGETLSLSLGPKPRVFSMRHWDRDVFLYQPTGEMSAGRSAVTFTIGADQRADRVQIEILNQNGQGSFVRTHETK